MMLDNKFVSELCGLLNKHGIDARVNIPDHLLAEHLEACIESLNKTTRAVKKWRS